MGGGDGSSETVYNYDPAYMKVMGDIAKGRFEMGEEMFEYFKEHDLPYIEELRDVERDLRPGQVDLSKAMTAEAAKDIERFSPIKDALAKAAMEGLDPGEEADKAQAGIEHSFAREKEQYLADLALSGDNPDDPGVKSAFRKSGNEKAKAIAGSRTLAKAMAKDKNFGKLATAMSLSKGISPGGTVSAPTGSGTASLSQNFFNSGINAMQAGRTPTGSTTTNSPDQMNPMAAAGAAGLAGTMASGGNPLYGMGAAGVALLSYL